MNLRLGAPKACVLVALLAGAQVMLPASGVVHVHQQEPASGIAGRVSVHGHGAGLPHDHAPAPDDDAQREDERGFHRIGSPVATLRAPAADWDLVLIATVDPPDMFNAKDRYGAPPIVCVASLRGAWPPQFCSGPPLASRAAVQQGRGPSGTRSLRGPPATA